MSLIDYSYLILLSAVGLLCLLVIFIVDVRKARKRHAQKLGESEEGKK